MAQSQHAVVYKTYNNQDTRPLNALIITTQTNAELQVVDGALVADVRDTNPGVII